MKLTFGSLNVQSFTDWETRKPTLVDYFRGTDPDIILFQEVTFLPQFSPYTQPTLLNQELGYPYEATHVTRLQPSHEYDTYREGLGILSKWPILRSETLILKQQSHDEHQRIVQLVDLLCHKKIVKLAHVHFSISDNDENLPRQHLYELMEILTARGETRIIGGDFNMNDIDIHADLWQDDYISSSTVPYMSYPPMSKRVDYFLLPKSYDFLDIKTSGDGLSDHRALEVAISDTAQTHNLLERVLHRSASFKN
jgi:endonuclease/exonuclease/phosphatase family metal-dependent hydrolase